jgi:hypothetical protein
MGDSKGEYSRLKFHHSDDQYPNKSPQKRREKFQTTKPKIQFPISIIVDHFQVSVTEKFLKIENRSLSISVSLHPTDD